MKLSDWIAETKILIFVPLLALIVAVVFVSANINSGDTTNADQTPAPVSPTPTIKTADNPATPRPASESTAATESTPGSAKVVFQVEGMSCSGCIAAIKSSLAGYEGIRDSIEAQVVLRLINDGIQMQEVQRVGYRIDPKLIDQEFDKWLDQKNIDPEGLKTSVEKSGYPFDYFMRKFENRVLLRHYIENQVLNNAASDYDKQQQYLAWFNNARSLSKVTIYDKRLQRLTQSRAAGAGCGSSCKS